MNIVVIGANGQLGVEIMKAGGILGWNMVPVGHSEDSGFDFNVDIIDYKAVLQFISDVEHSVGPITAIINCAAYHNMALCARFPAVAWDVNVNGPINITKALTLRDMHEDTLYVHISTDCVFGQDRLPIYREDSMRVPYPYGEDKGIYGQTKLAGEMAVQMMAHRWAIVRVATLFGVTGCRAKNNGNLIDSIAARALDGAQLTMHTNTRVSITYAVDAAAAICRTIEEMGIMMDHRRIVHACNDCGEGISHYEIALEVCKELNLIDIKDYKMNPEVTDRPRKSPLNPTYEMRKWDRAIRLYLDEKGWLKNVRR
jgi:dTDP-4-dehydrorhamnose reductase